MFVPSDKKPRSFKDHILIVVYYVVLKEIKPNHTPCSNYSSFVFSANVVWASKFSA